MPLLCFYLFLRFNIQNRILVVLSIFFSVNLDIGFTVFETFNRIIFVQIPIGL